MTAILINHLSGAHTYGRDFTYNEAVAFAVKQLQESTNTHDRIKSIYILKQIRNTEKEECQNKN